MREVARAAGVSVETVYASFGSKADLLMAVLDMAVVGDALSVRLAGRVEFTVMGEGSAAERAAAAGLVTQVHGRTAGIYLALREASAADSGLARRMREGEERRRASAEQGVALVAGRPVTPQERDGLWAVTGVEVYQLLTGLAGWTPAEYQAWLAGVIARLLGLDAAS
jgi:AcrR family transcriptional regulator